MDIKTLYELRTDRGFRGRLISALVWSYQNIRPPSPYPERNQQFRLFEKYLSGKGSTLLIGSNLPPERLKGYERVTQIDLKRFEHIDQVVNAEEMSSVLPKASFDYVVSTSMLEHTPHPWRVIAEVHQVLKPGGIFYLAVPWMFPFHGEGGDYWRFSLQCLQILMKENGFLELESGSEGSPHAGLHTFLRTYLPEVLSFGNAYAFYCLEFLFTWLLYPIGLLERICRLGRRRLYRTDSMLFIVGKKPA